MYNTKFKVGDKVRFNDGVQLWDGIISKIIQERDTWYPICVKFDADGLKCVFTLDGRLTYDSEVVLFKIKEWNMYEIKFKVGDRVRYMRGAAELDGIVSVIEDSDAMYPIGVKFETDTTMWRFTPDGRFIYNCEVVLFKIKECYMDKIKFQVGDRVKKIVEGIEYMGTISKIIRDSDFRYPICVEFDTDDREQWFTPDGSIDYNDEVVIFKIEEYNMDKIKFEVGDKVSWNGMLCTVVDMVGGSHPVVIANLDGNRVASFTLDGKFHIHMTEPSLKLVKRAKKKVKYYPALLHYSDGEVNQTTQLFNSLAQATSVHKRLNSCSILTWPYIPGVTEIEE